VCRERERERERRSWPAKEQDMATVVTEVHRARKEAPKDSGKEETRGTGFDTAAAAAAVTRGG
jgi:hypothetical protein